MNLTKTTRAANLWCIFIINFDIIQMKYMSNNLKIDMSYSILP